jgi:hypothetical protein
MSNKNICSLFSIFVSSMLLLLVQGCSTAENKTKLSESHGINTRQSASDVKVPSEGKLETTQTPDVVIESNASADNKLQASSAKIIISEAKTESTGTPKFVLEKSIYDFGKVTPNSTNTAIFNYTNTGSKPLQIKNLQKCCGAVVTLDKEEIAAGESGALTAKYNVGSGTGAFTRAISFTTNDPEHPQVNFTIKCEIVRTLEWTPESLAVSAYGKDNKSPEITIKSLDDKVFSIKNFKSTGQCFKADFDDNVKAKEFVLTPKLNIDKTKELTADKGTITIELDHPDYKTIIVNFTLIQALQVNPTQIILFNAKANTPVVKTIQLKDNTASSGEDISKEIASISLESGTKIDIRKISKAQSGCSFDLEIMPPEKSDTGAFATDKLTIELKDGRKLAVPIRIFYSSQEKPVASK